MGLILPLRPRLIYPGRPAGFDSAHPAAAGMTATHGFSGIGLNGGITSLARPAVGTNSGSILARMNGIIGSVTEYMPTSTNSTVFSGYKAVTESKATFAGISTTPDINFTTSMFANCNTAGTGLGVRCNASGQIVFIAYGIAAGLGTAAVLTNNTPYFWIASGTNLTGVGTCNYLTLNLNTGQILTGSDASVDYTGQSASDGSYIVANRPASASEGGNNRIAAVMFSPTYLSLAQMRAWAADPWSFWYPQKIDLAELLRPPPPSGPTGTLAATEAPDVAAFNGTAGVAGTLVSTESPDVASFNGTIAVTGTLSTTESPDTAAFNGNTVVSGTWASVEAADTAALSGNTVASGSFAVTEAQDVASFAGSGIVSGTFAATDTPDTAAFAGNAGTSGSLSATTSQDVAGFAGNFGIAGTLVSTEASDLAVFVGQFGIASGTLAANDNTDIAAFVGSATGAPTGSLAVTELPDNVVFLIDYMAPPSVTAASPYPSPFDYGWSYGEPPLRPGMPGSGTGRSS